MLDALDALYRQFGYFKTDLLTVAMTGIEGKQNMARMLEALRKSPPEEIGGLAVTGFEDLRDERGRLGPIKGATDAAARNFLIFRMGDRARLTLRPSGTEPKAKAYVEVSSPPGSPGMTDAAWQHHCRETDELAKRLADDFLGQALGRVELKPN